jgi:hypothetical protein
LPESEPALNGSVTRAPVTRAPVTGATATIPPMTGESGATGRTAGTAVGIGMVSRGLKIMPPASGKSQQFSAAKTGGFERSPPEW